VTVGPAPASATARYRTPASVVRRNALLLLAAVAGTVVVLRIWLHASPGSDFNIGGYNIHHLFTGLVLMTAGGVPLAVFRGSTRRLDAALVCFGAGLGMTLDEWVYLIVTDGSNAAYVTPVSLWGAVVVVGLACGYIGFMVAMRTDGRGANGEPRE
jgi:hypothetical protein